jgi:hypothetical protein
MSTYRAVGAGYFKLFEEDLTLTPAHSLSWPQEARARRGRGGHGAGQVEARPLAATGRELATKRAYGGQTGEAFGLPVE